MTEQTRENKKAAYELCLQQLSGLLEIETDAIANLANSSAYLHKRYQTPFLLGIIYIKMKN